MKLILNTPFWYILLCIAIGVLGAFLLYRKDDKLVELASLWKYALTGLRFLSISLLSFLLLEPLLEFSKEKVEKPILLIANDNSESMVFSKDSTQVKNQLKENLENLEEELSSKYEIVTYSFGDEVKEGFDFSYSSKSTNISNFFKEIQNRYYNRNLSGIVIASDGIYNSGSNPIFEVKKLKNIPVYTVAIGDTTSKKDVYIDQVLFNRLVYRGNDFPVTVEIKSEQCKGKNSVVTISKAGEVIAKKPIKFNSATDIQKVYFELTAEGTGLQKYKVSVSEIEGEFSIVNNYKNIYIDVLDSKEKILILTNSPHPDVNALKSALESNENYAVKSVVKSEFDKKIKDYNLVVSYNLPSTINNIDILGTPVLYILGNQTDFNKFNKINNGLGVNNPKGFTESQVHLNPNFSSFTISDELNSFVSSLSPIQVPFTTNYSVSNSLEVALFQKIGPVKTNYPLLAFNKKNNTKYGFFIGEGIWRWKLQDYSINKSNSRFNELFTQAAQYLITKEDKSLFRVFGADSYFENKKVRFEAEVYNNSYELVNSNDVKLKIINDENDEYVYSFSKIGDRYGLEVGILPPGNYKYTATTSINGKKSERKGEFSVNELMLEQNNSIANHQLLFNVSEVTKGKMVGLENVNSLINHINDQGLANDIIYQEKDIDDLINFKFLFFLILTLLCVEWFVRKRNGGY